MTFLIALLIKKYSNQHSVGFTVLTFPYQSMHRYHVQQHLIVHAVHFCILFPLQLSVLTDWAQSSEPRTQNAPVTEELYVSLTTSRETRPNVELGTL